MRDLFALSEIPCGYPGDARPVLLAQNNPQSSDPAHALYPHPPGCAGFNLYTMLATEGLVQEPPVEITKRAYLDRFDRRNLLSAREWSAADARRAAGALLDGLRGRRIAVLGKATLKACGLPERPWGVWSYSGSRYCNDVFEYVSLPHPSGRCREYNDSAMRALAGKVLLDMYLGEVASIAPPSPEGITGLL